MSADPENTRDGSDLDLADMHEQRHRSFGTWPCPWDGSDDCPVLHVLTGCCDDTLNRANG